MCVINFGDDIKYSLHIFSFVRITQKDKLLLTASDEFFDKDYNRLDIPDESFEDSLLNINVLKVKEILKNSILIKIKVSEFNDLELIFDNGVVVEVGIDCMYNNYEYYRFIEFIPDFENSTKAIHHIVKFKNQKIVCEKQVELVL